MSIGIKSLAGEIHSSQIVVVRAGAGLILILPILIHQGIEKLKTPQLKLHLLRGCFAAVAINFGFYSLTQLPLATATTLFFTAPLFVTLLAPYLLQETVGWRRYLATAVGFIGTVIVINPDKTGFDLLLLIPVVSSMFFAVSLILNKKLSKTSTPATMMFYIFGITLLFTSPIAFNYWQTPDINQWSILLGVVTVFAVLRTYFDIKGYSIGEASFVSPFAYLRILFIGLGAYLVFSEVPEVNVLIGAIVIIMSTLYIAQREYRLRKKK